MVDLGSQPRTHLSTARAMTAHGLAMVALALLVLGELLVVAVFFPIGRDVDRGLMSGWAYDDLIIDPLGAIVSTGFVATGAAVLMVVALARRRPALAIAVPVLVGGATVTTHLLKDRLLPAGGTLPSGHTTVVLSLLLAALLVVPPTWRRWLAPVAAFLAVTTGLGTVIGTWHLPGDVAAAAAVCLLWAGILVLLLGRRPPSRPPVGEGAPVRADVLALGGALAAFTLLAAYRLRWDPDGWLVASRLAGALLAFWIGIVVAWFARVLDEFVA